MKVNPLHSYITVWLEKIGMKKPDKPCLMTLEQKKMNMMLIDEEVQELMIALSKNDDIVELCDAYFDVLWVVTQSAMMNGININDIVRAGAASNLSKFCDTHEEAIKTVTAYTDGMHPNKQGVFIETRIEKINDSYIIKRIKDNKVLKSISFKEPDFSFIENRMKKPETV
jgi:NTP pyrophosphatase (non-canonical NTP hydrolase)